MRNDLEPRSFDGAGTLLARLAASSPHTAYALAGSLGALRNRITRRWPSAAEVQSLFPHVDIHDARRIARDIGALYERNRVFIRCARRHGIEHARELVTFEPAPVEAPAIFTTFHIGALHTLGLALEQLGKPILGIRDGKIYAPTALLQTASTKEGERARAAALHQATLHLRAGGFIVMAIDNDAPAAAETQCLGRRLRIAPGAFALARWTGAAIVPIAARWYGSRVVTRSFAPIRTPEDASAWLERYLLESPSEITLGLLRNLLYAAS